MAMEHGEQYAQLEELTAGETTYTSQLTPAQKAQAKKGETIAGKALQGPTAVGTYEKQGKAAASGLMPLAVGNGPLRHAAEDGTPLVNYQSDYNEYLFPLKATLRSMGRLEDLAQTGAPLDPALAPKRAPLSLDDQKDAGAENAYNDWSRAQTGLSLSVESHTASDMKVLAALSGFRAGQAKLQRMKAQVEKGEAEEKKHKIDETVETLVKIVEVSEKAVSATVKIQSLLSSVADPEDVDPDMVGKNEKEQHDIDRKVKAGARSKSVEQKIADKAVVLGEKLHVSAEKAEGWLKGAGFGLKDLFIVATGNAQAYDDLTRQIAKLNAQIENLQIEAEMAEIKQAQQALDAFSMELSVNAHTVSAGVTQARRGAQNFGQSLGGGVETQMMMYVAEAYEELKLFGDEAARDRAKLDPKVERIFSYIHDTSTVPVYKGHGWEDDWRNIDENARIVMDHRDYFSEKIPEWDRRATAWEQYLAALSGSRLVDH
jgi:hypothetical protein